MPANPLFGHEGVTAALGVAWARGRLPQAILLEGPEGVGKQRVGLWLAQLMFCERARDGAALDPCGLCRGCRLVAELSHPDLHWIVPVPRPKGSDPDKQVEEIAEALGDVMAERRKQPSYGAPDGMAIHGVATVRLIQRRAAMKSVEGGPQVFLIGRAERLVPQESSPEAANALLKLLEEPPPGCWFMLTVSEARRLLPTIRSRVVPLRLGRVPDDSVRRFGKSVLGVEGKALEALVTKADGAIGQVAGARDTGRKATELAEGWLAASRGGALERAEAVLRQPSWSARGEFSDALGALEALLVVQARRNAEEANDALRDTAVALGHVATARERAQGNVNPQLLLASILGRMAQDVGRE